MPEQGNNKHGSIRHGLVVCIVLEQGTYIENIHIATHKKYGSVSVLIDDVLDCTERFCSERPTTLCHGMLWDQLSPNPTGPPLVGKFSSGGVRC